MSKVIVKEDIERALREAGVEEGDTLIVHTSLRAVGYVAGGAETLLRALLECTGESGTIMMPTQSWKNLDPETGVHWEAAPEDWDIIRENWPAYDPDLTPTNTMGAAAEMLRKWPGAVRSAHPARSFAAVGRHAEELVADHDLSNIFGEGSPLSKLYDLNGKAVLIGVGHDKNTSLHLADARASYPSKHTVTEHSAIMEDGKRVWKAYETLYVDGEDFPQIGEAFEKGHKVGLARLGNAVVRVMPVRELADFAVAWIEQNRTAPAPA